MTTATRVDAAGGIHVFHHGEVPAGFPLFKGRLMRSGMAATANLARDFFAWALGQIHLVRRMRGRWSVATLALDSREVRRGEFGLEAGRQTKSNRVAGQAGGVVPLANGLERLERLRVVRALFDAVDAFVTFGAGLRPGVLRGGASDFEECVPGNICERQVAREIRGADGLPIWTAKFGGEVQLVVTRWTIPRDVDAVGRRADAIHHRPTGKAARLGDIQMRNFLRVCGGRETHDQSQTWPEMMCALLHCCHISDPRRRISPDIADDVAFLVLPRLSAISPSLAQGNKRSIKSKRRADEITAVRDDSNAYEKSN